MRQSTDPYFVQLHAGAPTGAELGRAGLGAPGGAPRRKRRRRTNGRTVFVALVLVGICAWGAWASQRPGGISGTINGWISNVRGDVAKVSADPDLATAQRYFNAQYRKTGAYPHLSEADLGGVGVGMGVNVFWCSPQAVVLQGASGGGTSSRLLLGGHDLGEVDGAYQCPADFTDPAPWKRP